MRTSSTCTLLGLMFGLALPAAANPDWRLMPRDRMAVQGEDDTGNGMAAVFRISVPGYAFRVRFEATLEDEDYRRSITPEGEKPANLEALPFVLVPAGSSLAIRLKDGVDPARLDLDQPQGGCACVIL